MPLGLGEVVILEYIEVALGLFVINDYQYSVACGGFVSLSMMNP